MIKRRDDDPDGVKLDRVFTGVDINYVEKALRQHHKYPRILKLFEIIGYDMKRAWIKGGKKEKFSKEILCGEIRYIMKIRNPEWYAPFSKGHLPFFMLLLFYYHPCLIEVFNFKTPVYIANEEMKRKLGL